MAVIDLTYKPLKVIGTPVYSNKSYTQSITQPRAVHGSSGASPLFITNEVTIQAGKGLLTYISVHCAAQPVGSGHSACSIATNIKVNGQWCSLGNSGYVITGLSSKSSLENYVAVRHIPFRVLSDKAGLIATEDYTLQVELVMKVQKPGSTIVVNDALVGFNGNIGNVGTNIQSGSVQNYTTIIVEETD